MPKTPLGHTRDALLTRISAQLTLAKADKALKALASPRVSVNTVSRVLRGFDHRVTTLAAIADALNCDLEIRVTPRNI